MNTLHGMKIKLDLVNGQIRELRKEEKVLEKENRLRRTVSDEIERLEKYRKFYQPSKSEPIQFENGVVVNAKLIRSYLKKLPRSAKVEFSLLTNSLHIQWSSQNEGKGRFMVKNLAEKYQGFDLPSAEAELEKLI